MTKGDARPRCRRTSFNIHASEIGYWINIDDALMDTPLLTNFTFIFLGLRKDFVIGLLKETKSMTKAQ